ncbi:hypothetical protein shim_23830 [Shimia sp. SK013]|uniref:hypothetical protein n=1 Tax=Shimia sp. SK013 TaxID=1389006 RepID=UPI0006B68F57|nr:hypothetical protein [Shimia sp. SK013]KPA21676.1 hypothetical protein shim_23830 [Shimia sp. SK013]
MGAARIISTTRRVIVHIGAQKTGSTSLHRFLTRNRDALAARLDVRVPEKGTLTRDLGRTCALYSLKPAAHEASLVDLLTQLRAELESEDRVCIISHENIVGAMMGRRGVRDLYPRAGEIVSLIETHLAPFKPDYVLYTRERTSWLRSVYNQAVKSDGYAGTQAAFEAETAKARDWAAVAAEVAQVVGDDRLRVFALEDETTADRPGRQLLSLAGLTDQDIDALTPLEGRSNQSLNKGSLEFMRQLNGLGLAQPARKKVAALVKDNQSLFDTDRQKA